MPYSITIHTNPTKFIYTFLSDTSLYFPEVTIITAAGEELFYTSSELLSEKAFRRLCDGAIITAVAAFDSEDTHRVNVTSADGITICTVYDRRTW